MAESGNIVSLEQCLLFIMLSVIVWNCYYVRSHLLDEKVGAKIIKNLFTGEPLIRGGAKFPTQTDYRIHTLGLLSEYTGEPSIR